ncbi:MAG TPA: glycosyl hydrolase family 18 protein [Saprospiraceae bacterium]|nr:glycosyl hydrolase family 18 protein [Saprospiraceae bacterium]HMQ82271.1 glycosyl hydrolase family 18 protein [Saprospiraceae bacterium]
MRRNIFFTSLFCLSGLLLCAQTQPRIVGYLSHQRFDLIHYIDVSKLTHLCLAFANPDAKGNLNLEGEDMTPVVQLAHEHGVKVLVSLAGGALTPEWESAWTAHLQPRHRAAFIHKMMNYLRVNNLDGVDVDLEWKYVDKNYSGFVLQLRDSLNQHGKLMTAALPAVHRYKNMSDAAMKAFDFINIMAYDLTGPWMSNKPGPHSSYSFAKTAVQYWKKQGVSGDRLSLGVPFYGWNFNDRSNVHSMAFGELVTLNVAYAHIDQVGEVYYNGINTIIAKTELAMEEVGGVMIWELGKDAFNEYSLLNTIYETIYGKEVKNLVFPEEGEEEEAFDFEIGTDGVQVDLLSIDVQPNPQDATLTIINNEDHAIDLQLANRKGRVFFETSVPANSSINWDISSFPSGYYVIRATDGDLKTARRDVKL